MVAAAAGGLGAKAMCADYGCSANISPHKEMRAQPWGGAKELTRTFETSQHASLVDPRRGARAEDKVVEGAGFREPGGPDDESSGQQGHGEDDQQDWV